MKIYYTKLQLTENNIFVSEYSRNHYTLKKKSDVAFNI
jgi:hypothetical protein